jgi:hypothetical protein
MAGDWIKLQKDTPDKPEVLAIASRMNLDPDAVVGKLVRIWSWFDTHTVDGNAISVTYSLLDRLAGISGFAEQMTFVGWLNQDGHVLTLPNFTYHNGETAKKRALGKNRQEKHRSNDESNAISNASSVTNLSLEKRREEKIVNKDAYASLSADDLPTCPHQEILILYKKHLPHLTQPRVWEGSRQTSLRQRWRQAAKPSNYSPEGYKTLNGGLAWWDSFFGYIANDSTLAQGFKTKDRTWQPDLEWIVNATNFAKIIDGKYSK